MVIFVNDRVIRSSIRLFSTQLKIINFQILVNECAMIVCYLTTNEKKSFVWLSMADCALVCLNLTRVLQALSEKASFVHNCTKNTITH